MATTPTAVAVHTAFGTYTRGQVIQDAATVATILASKNANRVHKLSIPATVPVAATVAAPVTATSTPASAAAAFEKAVAAAEAALHPSAATAA